MLDELEKLAREASGCAFTACGCRDCKAWAYAMNPATGLLLLAAVRAAEARPWLHRGQPPDPMIFGCDGCAGSIIDGDYIHGDGCDYRHIDAALDALKGST